MTTMLVQLYDPVRYRLVVRIQNGGLYVEDYITDEERENWPMNRDLRIQAQMRFMQNLCDEWSAFTGEFVEPVPPETEGQEWMIRPGYLEGEVVAEHSDSYTIEDARREIGA